MASNAKIVLRKKPNKEGLFPLAIRITKNRRSTYQYIGHYIELEDWDEKNIRIKKSHPNFDNLNSLLSQILSEANKALITLQSENKDASANQIKKEIYYSGNNATFFEIAQEHLDDLEQSNKLNRLSCDKAWIGFILKYHKSKQLTFQEINERFLKKLKICLKAEHSLSETSIMNILVLIRLLFNRAIKQKIVSKELYPFGSDKIRIKFPETTKVGLNILEIQKIESLDGLTFGEIHARNVWLYSFNFAGMRVSAKGRSRYSSPTKDTISRLVNGSTKERLPNSTFTLGSTYSSYSVT
jgi:Arm DNA-binding domain/Phage integrase SAM-like domain